MPQLAPVSIHLDLYRYWLNKRGARSMPARSDLDPADIPSLLPFVMVVAKPDGHFRYRLIGSALRQQLGRDVTGDIVGSQFVNAREAVAVKRAIYERVFTTARAVAACVEFVTQPGAIHNVLQLILPLSDDGSTVTMAVSTLVARLNFDASDTIDLKRLPVTVRSMDDLHAIAELEMLCLEWEQKCLTALERLHER